MSKGRICDHCDETIAVNDRGDDENGEIAAWLSVGTLDGAIRLDACSRSCAAELLADGSPLAEAVEARLEAVAEVVRAIRGDDDD